MMCCNCCGKKVSEEDIFYVGEKVYCLECLEEETVCCVECGERIQIDANEGTEERPLCSDCYERLYVTCYDCDTILLAEDAYYEEDTPYCEVCYERQLEKKVIHCYTYKPTPIFYGEGKRFFGVELEMDEGGKNVYNGKALLELANDEGEKIYIKEDGSLEDGFEIVSHPMTLEYHKNVMNWKELLREAVSMGYYSHQAGTAGLHIHVNRTCFGDSTEEQEDAISRVLYFVETFWNEMLCFSRRTETQMRQWADRYGRKESPKETLYHAKNCCNGRYTCVNLVNYNTIEFRLFRGTLKYNTLIATLQMVHEICNVAISFSDEEMDSLSWNTFVSGLEKEKMPELIQYLKERRLYCNEPVLCEEEM